MPTSSWACPGLGATHRAGHAYVDVGPFGMNTPAYFAMDDFAITFAVIPEPASLALLGGGLVAIATAAVRRRRRAG